MNPWGEPNLRRTSTKTFKLAITQKFRPRQNHGTMVFRYNNFQLIHSQYKKYPIEEYQVSWSIDCGNSKSPLNPSMSTRTAHKRQLRIYYRWYIDCISVIHPWNIISSSIHRNWSLPTTQFTRSSLESYTVIFKIS